MQRTQKHDTLTSVLVSVLSLLVILWLMVMEMMYYLETSFTYTFIPDTEFSEKLKINVDITVAMPCRCGYCGVKLLSLFYQWYCYSKH